MARQGFRVGLVTVSLVQLLLLGAALRTSPAVAGEDTKTLPKVTLTNDHSRAIKVAFYCVRCESWVDFGGRGRKLFVEVGAGQSKSPNLPHNTGDYRLSISTDGKEWHNRGRYEISQASPFSYRVESYMVKMSREWQNPRTGRTERYDFEKEELRDTYSGRAIKDPDPE